MRSKIFFTKALTGVAAILLLVSLGYSQTCAPTTSYSLGNGNDGENIAFNPADGLIYHTSGISPGDEYFEPVDPINGNVGANIMPGNTYPGVFDNEITALAWYPPLSAFIGMNRDGEIFSLTATGTFTLLSQYNGNGGFGYMRGFAVVGTNVYAISPDNSDNFIEQIDINTGNVITTINLTFGGNPTSGTGLATNPVTGDIWILYRPSGSGGNRDIGTVNLGTGVVTDIGDPGINGLAAITFDATGKLFAVSGDGGSPSETLFTDFPCAPSIQQAPVPTLSQWGIIILALLVVSGGVITVWRKRNSVKTA